jgi:nitrilase
MTVVVAAVQAAPVFLDREATVARVVAGVEDAAAAGAQLVVFPESFVPGYPDWVWRTVPWSGAASTLYGRLFENAVEIPSASVQALADVSAATATYLSVGVTEREGSTLYNTQLLFDPSEGLIQRHRKLMATGGERLVWAGGDGSTLTTAATKHGSIGALICWENYMPLARAALYGLGVDIYLAPTWDNSDMWIPTMRHIAKEGRVHVVGCSASFRGSDLPRDLPHRAELWPDDDDWLSAGNSVIVSPLGEVLAGPLIGAAGVVMAEIDVERARRGRYQFDPAGHYARSDVLSLVVDRRAKPFLA